MSTRKYIAIVVVTVSIFVGVGVDRYLFPSPDFDSIYQIVLSRVVDTHNGDLVSVALAHNDDAFTALPPRLQHSLMAAWSHNGSQLDLMIPTDRIHAIYGEVEHGGVKIQDFQRYVDAKTQKAVRVYVIDAIRWLGSDEILVNWSETHGALDARGSTIRLKRTFVFWRVVEETNKWIS